MKKNELQNVVNSIYLSEKSKEKIVNRATNFKNEKERIYMSKKKIVTLVAAVCLVLGVTVYAASGIITSWFSSSSGTLKYTELPTEQECINDIGYSPVLIGEFENGYAFKSATIVNNALKDDAGKDVEKFKSIDMRYNKNSEEIFISATKYTSDLGIAGEEVATVNETKIYYNKYKNKLVPINYEMTEEDKKAEADGELVFSYGMDEVTITEVQNLYFEKDGIEYTLTQTDATATVDELISMADEIINN